MGCPPFWIMGKRILLLLLHVLLEALGHLVEKIREPLRCFGVVVMDAFDLAGENNQAGKIAPVPIVEALEDISDDVTGTFGERGVMRRCHLAFVFSSGGRLKRKSMAHLRGRLELGITDTT